MKTKITILLSALILISSCKSSIEETVDLNAQNWIHGSKNCEKKMTRQFK
jgi:hydroxyacylglutathione hydrolase